MSAGDGLKVKAEKKAAGSGFSFFSSSSQKYEEAHELFTAAANAYKMDKLWKESGDCFGKAAEMALAGGEKDDAANDYWSASKSYKKTHPELAVAALQRTIQLYKEKSRFRQAADREKEIAVIWQTEGGGNLIGALDAYEAAGELYAQEDALATANSCFKEAADLAASLEQYPKAVRHFERVAAACLNSHLTKYSVKEYYLKAGMCWLATGDVVSTNRAIDEYSMADATFASTREAKFLHSIADAFDAGDAEAYTGAVVEYDRMTKLDNWKTALLLKIKQAIAEEPGLT